MVRAKRKRQGQPREPAAATAAALVLGNDDLLVEILLRLDFPTCLVRAAAVCRRWLRRASDPAFLRRFRALHPPRILGVRVMGGGYPIRFFPAPQPQELAAAARRAAGALPDAVDYDCRNGRMLIWTEESDSRYAVRSLLQPGPDKPLPARPRCFRTFFHGSGNAIFMRYLLLLEDDGDATSCLYLNTACDDVTFSAEYFVLQAGVWGAQSSAVTQLPQGISKTLCGDPLVSGSKVYMATTTAGCILVLDLATASFFTVELPEGTGHSKMVRLSRAQQSGLYVIDVAGFHLRIWLGDGGGQWVLVDTISVREACGHLNVQKWEPDDEHTAPIWIVGVGDNAELVILELSASGMVCCMQLSNRVVEKVADSVPRKYYASFRLIPMVWPPIFPALNQASEEH